MPAPFFSICIPVYKNVDYLKRLLDSIFIQTFTDYEVIITDDSPDVSIQVWLKENYPNQQVKYFKNPTALGTPENWNEAIRKANGQWIKLMHDDDWFAGPGSLSIFFQEIHQTGAGFIFSAFYNVYLEKGDSKSLSVLPLNRWKKIIKYPGNLYAHNIMGPPSVTVVKAELAKQHLFDASLKWLVDLDSYIRILETSTAVYINEPLVCIGVGSSQVTSFTQLHPEIEIPEGLHLHSKLGDKAFDHILYYDAWWRLIRNLSIRNEETLLSYAGTKRVPVPISKMIVWQKVLPVSLLKNGFVSKTFMFLSWLVH